MPSSYISPSSSPARFRIDTDHKPARLFLCGRLDANNAAALWRPALSAAKKVSGALIVDCAEVEYCDTAGLALLVALLGQPHAKDATRIENLAPAYENLLQQFDPAALSASRPIDERRHNLVETIGHFGSTLAGDAREQIAFVGETSAALGAALRHPRSLRWRDALAIAEEAGLNALPIVALIACLMGIIIAFQSAVAMRQFGAEIFVANLVGLSLLRELGPLMTAILLAGRSASAFAAELGSMKVNDEINALQTMGLDPIRFLVAPRILAALAMTPILTVFADAIGLLGGGMVMLLFNIPLITYFNQLLTTVQPADFFGGLSKSFVFALLIAGIGCLRGLQTGQGSAAVGISTTRAVVSSLVMIVVADGIFAVLFYHVGI
ncbi:MAG TPA: MlaE family lipid ABC transporter permease subunit [Burkholderiales bacterium]|nr:MlaE family lipid ABC transporter permease subunit [Burkholderiales bacterium]